MNLLLMLATILANVVAVALIYQFVTKDDKRSQILFIAISFGIIYIAVSIIYAISSIGIEKSVNEAAKNYIIFLFVPINVILLVPFVATKYVKYRSKKIKKEVFIKRVISITLIALVLLTIECISFRGIKQNIKTINKNINQTKQEENELDNKHNKITNQAVNELTNEVIDKKENKI